MISLACFRERVEDCLGPGLCRATPEAVRDFLDRMQAEMAEKPPDGRYALDEAADGCEEVLASFFWQMLHVPPEEAVVLLWLVGFEACHAAQREAAAAAAGEL